MRQSENEIDQTPQRTYDLKALALIDKDVQLKQLRQNQPNFQTNTEPEGKLYILTPIQKPKTPQAPVSQSANQTVSESISVPVSVSVSRPGLKSPSAALVPVRDIKNTQPAQSAQSAQTNKINKIPPVKKLVKKFRKNGLGIIDSYFNAYFFYYDWKSEKKGRKTKNYLKTVARHPKGWGKKTNRAVYKKNIYDNYMSVLTGIAKFSGAVSSVCTPVKNFFKSVGNFFGNLKNLPKTLKTVGSIMKKTCEILIPAAAIAFTIITISNINSFKPQLALTLDGREIGFVRSKEAVGKAVSLLENTVSSILNEPYEFPGNISYRIILSDNTSFVSTSEIYDIMYGSSQNAVTSAYGLYIDGELVGAAENENDINQVLNEVRDLMSDENDVVSVEFANEIEIIENDYDVRSIVSQNELKNIISPENPGDLQQDNPAKTNIPAVDNAGPEYEYEILDPAVPLSDGSSLLTGLTGESNAEAYVDANDIAVMAAASSLSLTPEAVNTIPRGFLDSVENANENNPRESGILSLISKSSAQTQAPPATPIQFKKIKTESYSVSVPFDVKYVESPDYYVGTQVVRQNGSNGENRITADITYIADNEVEREIKNVEIIKAPVSKVIVKGTKPKPLPGPTGGFVRPVRGGYVTSRFGKGHRGIDYVVPSGTPISASDGGTVIYAGFSGSYGNHVKLRHNDGFVTIYAHMSSIGVGNGEKVFQGQEIGKVGSTGNSSGPHLHFEIIKNGVLVNPESYVR